eukprot:m.52499 g.52499  ORF g.52499 m.52499 type:complete len:571 (+) comp34212_c0_seq2:287-1999(+)
MSGNWMSCQLIPVALFFTALVGTFVLGHVDSQRLDLNDIGATMEFRSNSSFPLLHGGNSSLAMDGNTRQLWTECAVSVYSKPVWFLIDLGGVHEVDQIKVLFRYVYGFMANVYVGLTPELTDGRGRHKCGGSYPHRSWTGTMYSFPCSTSHLARYVGIVRNFGQNAVALQVCEVSIYNKGYKLDLQAIKAKAEFKLLDLLPSSSYAYATDGRLNQTQDKCTASNGRQSVWLKIDLHGFYPVHEVKLLSQGRFGRGAEVYVGVDGNYSNSDKREKCRGSYPDKAPSSLYSFPCPTVPWIRYIFIARKDGADFREAPAQGVALHVCEVEVYYDSSKTAYCGKPALKNNVLLSGSAFYYPNAVSFHCPLGYTLKGSSQSTCQTNGNWSATSPECRKYSSNCDFPPHLANATVTTDWKTATYRCNKGFTSLHQSLICNSGGEWIGQLRHCLPLECPRLGHLEHGKITVPPNRTAGVRASFSCAKCYFLFGDRERKCQVSTNRQELEWSGKQPRCEIIQCGNPPQVKFGNVSIVSKTCGEVATYTCEHGLFLYGNRHLFCSATGKWIGKQPRCLD